MIMNKVVTILGLVVLAGYAAQEVSWAHKHVVAQEERQGPSLISAELDEFVVLVPQVGDLPQRAEQPSWNRLSLTHTDTNYLPGSERHHPAAYRSFNAPDGVALMFSWPFASVPTFWMSPQGSSNEPILNRDHPR